MFLLQAASVLVPFYITARVLAALHNRRIQQQEVRPPPQPSRSHHISPHLRVLKTCVSRGIRMQGHSLFMEDQSSDLVLTSPQCPLPLTTSLLVQKLEVTMR